MVVQSVRPAELPCTFAHYRSQGGKRCCFSPSRRVLRGGCRFAATCTKALPWLLALQLLRYMLLTWQRAPINDHIRHSYARRTSPLPSRECSTASQFRQLLWYQRRTHESRRTVQSPTRLTSKGWVSNCLGVHLGRGLWPFAGEIPKFEAPVHLGAC